MGRNISECLARLGAPVRLLSVVGSDAFGSAVLSSLKDLSIVRTVYSTLCVCVLTMHGKLQWCDLVLGFGQESHVTAEEGLHTAVYSALLNESGGLVAAVSDMDCFNAITPALVKQWVALL